MPFSKNYTPHNKKEITWNVIPETGCWECTSHKPSNFGYVNFRYLGKTKKIHRHHYEIYKGKIEKGLVVMHTCDNRKCINPDHLILGTQQDNIKDMFKKGRNAKGKDFPNTKLDEEKVRFIRSSNLSRKELGIMFNTTYRTIADVLNFKNWKYVK